MKYITLLIFPFLMLACGTETSVEETETETVRIGSFDVVTNLKTGEKHADWVGESSTKMKQEDSDTTWYNSPDGHAILIEESATPGKVRFTYRDSSYTEADINDFTDHDLSTPFIAVYSNWAFSFGDGHMEATTSIEYTCNEEYDFTEDEAIEFRYTYEGVQYVHLFNVNGMIDSMEHVMGCHK